MTEQPTELDPGAAVRAGVDRLDPAVADYTEPPGPPAAPSAEEALLAELADLPEKLRNSTVAVTAVILARSLDAGELVSRDQVVCVREIRMCIAQLREWNPAGDTGDETDAARAQVETVRALYAVTAE
jgi:hypothetical protein